MPPRKSDNPDIPIREVNSRYLRHLALVRLYAKDKKLTFREVMISIVKDSRRLRNWKVTRKFLRSRIEVDTTEE